MILADTSVWVRHFRSGEPLLRSLLEENQILLHPFIIGELACGNLARRQETLQLLRKLPAVEVPREEEVFRFLEVRQLWGKGLGWIDVNLLASAKLAGCTLWTLDRRLRAAAEQEGLKYDELR